MGCADYPWSTSNHQILFRTPSFEGGVWRSFDNVEIEGGRDGGITGLMPFVTVLPAHPIPGACACCRTGRNA